MASHQLVEPLEERCLLSDVTFTQPRVDYPTGSSPTSVAAADFNGDGKIDLAVANNGSDTVSVLLGDGTGGFGPKTDFATGSSPTSVTAADFNGDGKIDLAVGNGNSTVSVLLGNGSGGFGPKTDFPTGLGPCSVTAADFNGDGKIDLAVANYNSNTVSILLGNGSGGFGVKTDFATGSWPSSVTAADFNGDGKIDLAVANHNSSTVSVLLGNGSGGFGPKTDFATGSWPYYVTAADFNGDGKIDLVTAHQESKTVSVLLGNGSGGFGTKTDFATGSWPSSVTAADFSGDGKIDLAVANYNSNTVSVLLGNGNGGFVNRTDFATGSMPTSVTVADFNGDGKIDLATANRGSNTVSVLLGNGMGGFGAKTDFATGLYSNPVSVTAADFNGDGNIDLATGNYGSGTVSVLLGDGNGGFGKTDFATGSWPISVTAADFNGDGNIDLATANYYSNTVSVLLGNGSGGFGAKTDFATGSYPTSVTAADFNADGKIDLATANAYWDGNGCTVSVLLGDGNGGFGNKTDFATGSHPNSVTAADFNGDGKIDLAIANCWGSNTVSVLLGDGGGSFGLRTDVATGTFPFSVTPADFNGDGKIDLATANQGGNTVSVLLNQTYLEGDANKDDLVAFADYQILEAHFGLAGQNWGTGDFNNDGQVNFADYQLLEANFGKSFIHPPTQSITGVKWNDLDGDGVKDPGEPGLPGWTIFLDQNNNGVLDSSGIIFEPDNYADETVLDTVLPGVTLYATNTTSGHVFSRTVPSDASTGVKVFCHNPGDNWNMTNRLRITFAQPVASMGIDFINWTAGGSGCIDAYDANNNLLASYITGALAAWQIQSMTITRPSADIAYALASGSGSYTGTLDNLVFGSAPEPSVVTGPDGSYAFTGLAPGIYTVAEVMQSGWTQTYPSVGGSHTLTLAAGQIATGIDFGNWLLEPSGTPSVPDLLSAADSGVSSTDNITIPDNSSGLKTLRFSVSDTVSVAAVTIHADGIAVGQRKRSPRKAGPRPTERSVGPACGNDPARDGVASFADELRGMALQIITPLVY